MVTCFVDYRLDPYKLEDFERYARTWIGLIEKFGGTNHGFFLPSEGCNNRAVALFSFPSLSAYEEYRQATKDDQECQQAFAIAEETRCIKSYDRSFFRPLRP